jgi:cell division protein FtsB
MQKRVMEKVEELTLYIIQLNKENQQLKQEVTELRKLIEKK